MTHLPALLAASTLVHLAPVDFAIIAFYFALVLAIGLYLKERANTGEDFFMAGREMTAWVAGLAFLSRVERTPEEKWQIVLEGLKRQYR